MTTEDLERLRKSTAKSGAPLKVEHPAVIAKLRRLIQDVKSVESKQAGSGSRIDAVKAQHLK
ncbi:hypothetical protein OG407_23975 [Streptomyces sp. NBC_01515]|uniref:hypothetical protein n=1 Tax=Streptomyces sp. NBC_01515 TaxID=2903890 RepID=UPI00386A24EB